MHEVPYFTQTILPQEINPIDDGPSVREDQASLQILHGQGGH